MYVLTLIYFIKQLLEWKSDAPSLLY